MSNSPSIRTNDTLLMVLDPGEEPASNPAASVQLDNAENNSWSHGVSPSHRERCSQ